MIWLEKKAQLLFTQKNSKSLTTLFKILIRNRLEQSITVTEGLVSITLRPCLSSNDLLLWSWYFFDHNPGHWVPAWRGVRITVPPTVADVKSYSHHSPWDVLTVAFNVADTKGLFTWGLWPNQSGNGYWTTALSAIESKEPALAASTARLNAKRTRVEHSQGGFVVPLFERAILLEESTFIGQVLHQSIGYAQSQLNKTE